MSSDLGSEAVSGLVSTWMGDRLGIPGAVSFSFSQREAGRLFPLVWEAAAAAAGAAAAAAPAADAAAAPACLPPLRVCPVSRDLSAGSEDGESPSEDGQSHSAESTASLCENY